MTQERSGAIQDAQGTFTVQYNNWRMSSSVTFGVSAIEMSEIRTLVRV